jgi:hypothetical protein
MHKEVICQHCGEIVWVVLFPFIDLDKIRWSIGLCHYCKDIAYIRRVQDDSPNLSGNL